MPLVAEATGTWDPAAGRVLKAIARAAAARTGEDPVKTHAKLLQELCVVIRGYRARAVLRRRADLVA